MDIPWNHGQSMELPSHISMELHGISLEGFSWKVHGNSMEIHGNSLEISALQILLDTLSVGQISISKLPYLIKGSMNINSILSKNHTNLQYNYK